MRELAAILGAVLLLTLGAAAEADAQRYLSVQRASMAIERWMGPETLTTSCKRLSRTAVRCEFLAPTTDVGLTCEHEGQSESCGPWEGSADAVLSRHEVRVSSPYLE